jgi:SAM-dependent methyltransferase
MDNSPQNLIIQKCVHCKCPVQYISVKTGEEIEEKKRIFIENSNYENFYAQCQQCMCVYYLNYHPKVYEKEYFHTEYKAQYGVTYEEDRCAMGYFLEELLNHGFQRLDGIEVSSYAVQKAVIRKGITYYNSSFFDFIQNMKNQKSSIKRYDLINSFFVLEHLERQREFFTSISSLLRPGGIFYFSLPSINGPLFRYQKEKWLSEHPEDHFIDYSPQSLQKILPGYGFNILGFRIPSYHISRARGILGFLNKIGSFGESIYKFYCNLYLFGDTLECAARKR